MDLVERVPAEAVWAVDIFVVIFVVALRGYIIRLLSRSCVLAEVARRGAHQLLDAFAFVLEAPWNAFKLAQRLPCPSDRRQFEDGREL